MKKFLIASATAAALAMTAFAPAMAADVSASDLSTADNAKIRSENYKLASDTMKAIGADLKAKKVDAATIKERTAIIADAIKTATAHYGEGQAAEDKSDAKKIVWDEQEKFQKLAEESIATINAMADTGYNPTLVGRSLDNIGNSCGACHKVYKN